MGNGEFQTNVKPEQTNLSTRSVRLQLMAGSAPDPQKFSLSLTPLLWSEADRVFRRPPHPRPLFPPRFETGETVNLCSRVSNGVSVLPDPLVPCRVNFYEFRPGIPPPLFSPARIRANWPPIHGEIQLAAANRPPIPAELTRVKATERRGKWKRRKGRGGIIAPREKEFSKTIPLVFRG